MHGSEHVAGSAGILEANFKKCFVFTLVKKVFSFGIFFHIIFALMSPTDNLRTETAKPAVDRNI